MKEHRLFFSVYWNMSHAEEMKLISFVLELSERDSRTLARGKKAVTGASVKRNAVDCDSGVLCVRLLLRQTGSFELLQLWSHRLNFDSSDLVISNHGPPFRHTGKLFSLGNEVLELEDVIPRGAPFPGVEHYVINRQKSRFFADICMNLKLGPVGFADRYFL